MARGERNGKEYKCFEGLILVLVFILIADKGRIFCTQILHVPLLNGNLGYIGIAPTRNCTYFLNIGFVVADILKGNESDKEKKIVRISLF